MLSLRAISATSSDRSRSLRSGTNSARKGRGSLVSALVRPLLWLAVFAAGFRNVFGVVSTVNGEYNAAIEKVEKSALKVHECNAGIVGAEGDAVRVGVERAAAAGGRQGVDRGEQQVVRGFVGVREIATRLAGRSISRARDTAARAGRRRAAPSGSAARRCARSGGGCDQRIE